MTHLYVMSRSDAPGLLKVGRSDDPERRAGDLQSGHCFWITVQAVINDRGCCEHEVHRRLQHACVDGPGREWFRVDLPKVLETIAAAVQHVAHSNPATIKNRNVDITQMLSLTPEVTEASSAAEVRRGISVASELSIPQVHAAMVRYGFEELNQHFTAHNPLWQPFRTSKRVYKKDRLFAALAQPDSWMANDAVSDGEPVANDA
jgi:hypothetical protein